MSKILLSLLFTLLCYTSFAAPSINFAVIGDYGVDSSDEEDIANLVKSKNPDFILTVGDNNYPDGCAETIDKNIGKYYHNYILNYTGSFGEGSATQRFYPTLGNHDWNAKEKCLSANNSLPYFDYFTLPGNERYYDFVEGPIHFFALDSDDNEPDGNKRNSKQYNWLKNRLRSSRSPFKIAYFHHSPYSTGPHGNNKDLQWDFDKLGIHVVLTGHDHIYERFYKQKVVYIVNGLGGAPRYENMSLVEEKAAYSKKHGALFVSATNNLLTLQFINSDNVVVDKVILRKTLSMSIWH